MYFARIYPVRSYALGVTISDSYPGGMYISAEPDIPSVPTQWTTVKN